MKKTLADKPLFWHAICLLLVAMPIFAHLDSLPIQLWDESRLAINSYEMYKNQDWMVSTYNGKPDLWNTKPPLLLWLQVVSFKILGVNELALRLPSAIAGMLTCLLVYWIFARKKQYLHGFLAVLILVTSMGFIKYHHSTRTGDYDALLTFFTTAYCICYYLYIEESKRKYLWLTVIFITLAVMTKTIAGLMFLPALFVYTIYKRRFQILLKEPAFYLGILLIFGTIGGYYWLREQYIPGYFEAVKNNDFWGRYAVYNGTDRPTRGALFYFDLLTGPYFAYWCIPLVIGILLIFIRTNNFRSMSIYFTLTGLLFFAIISSSTNKNDWYDMPMYPLISIVTAIGIMFIYETLKTSGAQSTLVGKLALTTSFVVLVALLPLKKTIENSIGPDPGIWIANNTNMCKYLKKVFHGQLNPENEIVIVSTEYAANVEWYANVIRDMRRIQIRVIPLQDVKPTERIIAFHERAKRTIESTYNFTIAQSLYDSTVITYQLQGKKTQSISR
jgi:4-amino-4-deoxy-L-arabinose transferase-like glycosyltransferase